MMEQGNMRIKMNDLEEKVACSVVGSDVDASGVVEEKVVVEEDAYNPIVEELPINSYALGLEMEKHEAVVMTQNSAHQGIVRQCRLPS